MVKIKKIKPMFNAIVTTMDKYESDSVNENGIIEANKMQGTIKEYQKVVAVGASVREIKEGDLVLINPMRYAVKKHQEGTLKDNVITDNPVIAYNFNTVELNGKPHLLLFDSDVSYIITEYEDTEVKSKLILPKPKKIIV